MTVGCTIEVVSSDGGTRYYHADSSVGFDYEQIHALYKKYQHSRLRISLNWTDAWEWLERRHEEVQQMREGTPT